MQERGEVAIAGFYKVRFGLKAEKGELEVRAPCEADAAVVVAVDYVRTRVVVLLSLRVENNRLAG